MTTDSRIDREAASLARQGRDVVVLCLSAEDAPATESRLGFTIQRCGHPRPSAAPQTPVGALIALAKRGAGKVLRSWPRVALHRRTLRDGAGRHIARAKVVHAHDLPTLGLGAELAAQWRAKLVYDAHELYSEPGVPWSRLERRLWLRHEARWLPNADAVITVSPEIADVLRWRHGLAKRPTVVENRPVVGPPDETDVRSACGLDADTKLCVYAGTASEARGMTPLLEALVVAQDWHMAIVGGGADTSDVVERAQQLGLGDRLHILRARPAAGLWHYLASATVGVHPLPDTSLNHRLALPNKLFEYLTAGLPVAVSDLPAMRRVVHDNNAGVVFDTNSPIDIARALDESTSRPHHPPPDERWSWPSAEAQLAAVYTSLHAETA